MKEFLIPGIGSEMVDGHAKKATSGQQISGIKRECLSIGGGERAGFGGIW